MEILYAFSALYTQTSGLALALCQRKGRRCQAPNFYWHWHTILDVCTFAITIFASFVIGSIAFSLPPESLSQAKMHLDFHFKSKSKL